MLSSTSQTVSDNSYVEKIGKLLLLYLNLTSRTKCRCYNFMKQKEYTNKEIKQMEKGCPHKFKEVTSTNCSFCKAMMMEVPRMRKNVATGYNYNYSRSKLK